MPNKCIKSFAIAHWDAHKAATEQGVRSLVMNGCLLKYLYVIAVATWTIEVAASSPIVVPVDLEKQAVEMNALCTRAAPNLKPGYLERFKAWKQRLGPYYERYQQLLYNAPVMHLPEPERASKLKELITLVEEQTSQRMQELQKNHREAHELCMLMGNGISDPKQDEELKRFVNEVAAQ